MGVGEIEGERGEEGGDEAVVTDAGKRTRIRLESMAPLLDLELELDEFVQGESLAGDAWVIPFLGEVQHVNRVGARWQIVDRDFRSGLFDLGFQLFDRAPDQSAQPTL